jgi:hypothetical protein
MTEGDLLAYRKRLLDAGVSRKIVNRNIRELRDHREDITRVAQQYGSDASSARADAQRQVGTPGVLADAMIARAELRCIFHRHPLMLAVFAPPLMMIAIYVLAVFLLITVGGLVYSPGSAVVVPAPAWMAQVLSAFRTVFMHWLTPLCTLVFCHIAIRAHVRVYYWMLGMFLLCLLGSTVYMQVSMPDPVYAREGSIGVSIGYQHDDSLGMWERLSANLLLCCGFVWYSLWRQRAVEFA